MTKQDILNNTGLSEEEFYQRYPDQKTFCSEYPDMCPDMMEDDEEEDISNYQNLGYDESEINMAAYGGSMYEAQDGVETTAPYTDYNQYTNAMQNYGTEASKAGVYNNFQNDLYNQSGTSRGSRETTSQLGDMFNTLSPEQQDALAQKYGAQFMPSSTPSASRRNYVNSMEMNVPGKGTGYYSFPTNDVVYGSKQLERPNYEFPAMTMAPYKMPVAPPKKFSVEPTQLINNISAGYKNPASLNTNNGNLPIPKYSMTNTIEKVGATNKPYVASAPNYTSIIDLLKARKQDSSFTNRKRLAEEAGIKNYTGSASQNMDFINRINGIKSSGTEMELGGVNIHPAMRTNFKQGGYYGMDGRLHKAKGSGTYVMNGGYYFQPGGTNTAPPVASPNTPPGAMGDPASVPPSSLIDKNMPNADGTFNIDPNETYNFEDTPEDSTGDFGSDGTGNARQQRRNARRNTQYETPDLGGLYDSPMDEQPVIEPYDPSQYSSAIDPVTGFTNYSKNNKVIKNIKRDENALWQQLKEEGNGARFRTGQTDVQKFGRAAGKVAATGDALINVAGAFGNLIDSQNEQRNLNNSAINKGSTASMYTNPQGAGKGNYGQTGSSYGMTDPTSVGARSFKGMYGKYGMEVPKFQPGGGFSNLFPSAQSVVPISSPVNLMPNISFAQVAAPVVDNTTVYRTNKNVNSTPPNMPTGTLDVDAALKAVAGVESGSKPGETKVGMGTKLIGEGGKKASASGTYQITTPTLQDIYNNDKSISSKYDSFNKFKSAFDVDANVEYEAAKSLMSRHIKNYGIYALGAWYQPEFARRAAKGDKSVFDIVPAQDYGNKVKWGDDFNKKLNAYNKLAGTNYTPNTTFNTQTSTRPGNNNTTLKNLIGFAKENNFNVTSTTGGRHNVGSRHGKGRAIDVSVKNKTPEQINQFMQSAQNLGFRVLDERVRPKGQKEWHGAHLHLDFEKGGQFGGQVMEMDETEIKQFLKAGGQLEFLD